MRTDTGPDTPEGDGRVVAAPPPVGHRPQEVAVSVPAHRAASLLAPVLVLTLLPPPPVGPDRWCGAHSTDYLGRWAGTIDDGARFTALFSPPDHAVSSIGNGPAEPGTHLVVFTDDDRPRLWFDAGSGRVHVGVPVCDGVGRVHRVTGARGHRFRLDRTDDPSPAATGAP